MMLLQTILVSLVFLMTLFIAIVKTSKVWQAQLKELTRSGQLVVICVLIAAISIGGTKVGPTKTNLKILIAEREAKKLSSGQVYGDKERYREGLAFTDSATSTTLSVADTLPGISNIISTSSVQVYDTIQDDRHYIRLTFERPELTEQSNLYSEIVRCTTSNGMATAYISFSIVPNAEPQMSFVFATGITTNVLAAVKHVHSSFPDTFLVGGYSCYAYSFPIPEALVSDGKLIAPIDFERQVAFGSPEAGKPFNVDGGIAIFHEGQYWIGVTGWRTNAVDGVAYYFSNGFLADPPQNKTSSEEPNEKL